MRTTKLQPHLLIPVLLLAGCTPSYSALMKQKRYAEACTEYRPDSLESLSSPEQIRASHRMLPVAWHLASRADTRISLRGFTPAELEHSLGWIPTTYRREQATLLGVAYASGPRFKKHVSLYLDRVYLNRTQIMRDTSSYFEERETRRLFGIPEPKPTARAKPRHRPSIFGRLVERFISLASFGVLRGLGRDFRKALERVETTAVDTVQRLKGLSKKILPGGKKLPQPTLQAVAAIRQIALLKKGGLTEHGLTHHFYLMQPDSRTQASSPVPKPHIEMKLFLGIVVPKTDGWECNLTVRLRLYLPPGPTLAARLRLLFPKPRSLRSLLRDPRVELRSSGYKTKAYRPPASPRTPAAR